MAIKKVKTAKTTKSKANKPTPRRVDAELTAITIEKPIYAGGNISVKLNGQAGEEVVCYLTIQPNGEETHDYNFANCNFDVNGVCVQVLENFYVPYGTPTPITVIAHSHYASSATPLVVSEALEIADPTFAHTPIILSSHIETETETTATIKTTIHGDVSQAVMINYNLDGVDEITEVNLSEKGDYEETKVITKTAAVRELLVKSRYADEAEAEDQIEYIAINPAEATPERPNLSATSTVENVSNELANVKTVLVGGASERVDVVYTFGAASQEEKNALDEKGTVTIATTFPRYHSDRTITVKTRYADETEEHESVHEVLITANPNPVAQPKRLVVDFRRVDAIMKGINSGLPIEEAIKVDIELNQLFQINPHLIVRDTRNSFFHLFKVGITPQATTDYNGVWRKPVSYSIDTHYYN